MIDNYRIVVVIPSGRQKYLELLLPHILDQQQYIDEIHFWLNTTNQEDISYIENIQKSNTNIFKIIYSKIPINGASSLYHFWYTSCDNNTIYIRLDDDVCWLSKNFIFNVVKCRIKNPDAFLVFPIIINNDMNYGLTPTFGSVEYVKWFEHPYYGAQSHALFFNWLKKQSGDDFNFGNIPVPLTRSLNINSVCWFGEDMRLVKFETDEEEHEISHTFPNKFNRPNMICGNAMCCHFGFMSQKDYMLEKTNFYHKYKILSDRLKKSI